MAGALVTDAVDRPARDVAIDDPLAQVPTLDVGIGFGLVPSTDAERTGPAIATDLDTDGPGRTQACRAGNDFKALVEVAVMEGD